MSSDPELQTGEDSGSGPWEIGPGGRFLSMDSMGLVGVHGLNVG